MDLSDKYILVRSSHLVSVGLFLFIKSDMATRIRDLECCCVKTGFAGMAANKCGIAFSLYLDDTSLCFATAHFAAGQNNEEDRNNDYWTIVQGLQFKKNKRLLDHDIALFMGDFNYRINAENSEVLLNLIKRLER
jgi:hypothetical protein